MQTIDLNAMGVAPRTIRIKRLEPIRTTAKWTLYAVEAEELDGTPIRETLRTFDPLAGEVEVTQEARMSKDGTAIESYTLKPTAKVRRDRPSGGDPGLLARITALESEVADLTRKYNALIKAFGEE